MTDRHIPVDSDLNYFTVTCHLAPIVADFSQDSDYDPNTARIDAVVTFTPKYKTGEVIHSHTSTPPTGFLALPVTALIDDGYLKLRAKADLGAAPLPGTLHGLKAKIAADTGKELPVETDLRALNYAPVRLLGNSASLEIDPEKPLYYDFSFSNIKIDGKTTNIQITGGTFEAPWEDTLIDLLDYMPLTPGPFAGPMVVGPQGPQGEPGPATIDVGSTTTSAPGSDASVSNVGDTVNAVLDFVIPRGDVGPPGPAGGLLEFDTVAGFPVAGTAGQVFLAKDTNDTYRWDGAKYVRVSERVLSTGITDSTVVGRAVVTAVDATAARDAIEAVSDFDPRLDDNRMPIDGSVTTQKLEASIATTVGALQSPYFGTSTTGVLNADNGTDAAAKRTGFGVPSFTIADKPFFGMTLAAEAATNTVRLGGGSTRGRAATQIEFYTAGNTTTDAGTRWARITGTGDTYFYGGRLQVGDDAGPQATIAVNSGPTASSDFTWGTSGYGRWTLRANEAAETGGDAGSDLVLLSRTDAGVPKDTLLTVTRSTGVAKFSKDVSFGGTVVARDFRPQPAVSPAVSAFRFMNQVGVSQFEFECNDNSAALTAAVFRSDSKGGVILDLAKYAPPNTNKSLEIIAAGSFGGLVITAPAGANSTLYARGGTTLLYVNAAAGMELNAVPVVTATGVASLSNKTLIAPTITGASGTTACLFTSAAASGNYVQITGTAPGIGSVVIASAGSDTNCNVSFNPKGAGLLTTRVDATISPTGVEISSARVGVKVDPPTKSNSVGRPGQFAVDSDGAQTPTYYLYMCVANNVWLRTTMTTF